MLQQEFEIQLPYPGHLVQQNQGFLKKRVDLFVFGGKDSGVQPGNMFGSELEILLLVVSNKVHWSSGNPPAHVGQMKLVYNRGTHHLPELVGTG